MWLLRFGYRPRHRRAWAPNPVHSMYDNLCASINRDNRTFSVPVECKSQKLFPRSARVSSAWPCSSVRQVNHWKGLRKSMNSQLPTCGSCDRGHRGRVRTGVGSEQSEDSFTTRRSELWGGYASAMPLALDSVLSRRPTVSTKYNKICCEAQSRT